MTPITIRPISLSALTVLDLAPPQVVACAAEAGYSHVGLRLVPATDTEVRHDMVGDTPLVRETIARLKDTGIKVLDVEILRLKPDTVVSDYKPMLDTAAELGARFVLVAGNDPDEARLIDRLGALCDIARPLGLSPYLEPMPWTDAKNLKQANRIVTATGRENVGVIIDPIHFDRARDSIEDIQAIPRRYLGYLQFCDAPAERPTELDTILFQARCERLLPGEGGIDLVSILRAVPDDIPISVEVPTQELAKTVSARERAVRAREATLKVLARR